MRLCNSSINLIRISKFKVYFVHGGCRHKITFKLIPVQDCNRLATGFFDHILRITKFG